MASRSPPQYPVESIATTLQIIEMLYELNGAGVAKLADQLDMPKSTVHDHLQTLAEAEYLVNKEGTYHVGTRFLELGGFARSETKLYQVGSPELYNLANETGEHANLMIEEHGKGVFLDKSKGENAVTTNTHIGKRVHLHTTALGKSILAYKSDEVVEEIIERHGLQSRTEHTTTDQAKLKRELKEIRNRGYAITDEERVMGICCIAAPIYDKNENPLGAIGVSGPTNRYKDSAFKEKIIDSVTGTANVVEINMDHS